MSSEGRLPCPWYNRCRRTLVCFACSESFYHHMGITGTCMVKSECRTICTDFHNHTLAKQEARRHVDSTYRAFEDASRVGLRKAEVGDCSIRNGTSHKSKCSTLNVHDNDSGPQSTQHLEIFSPKLASHSCISAKHSGTHYERLSTISLDTFIDQALGTIDWSSN